MNERLHPNKLFHETFCFSSDVLKKYSNFLRKTKLYGLKVAVSDIFWNKFKQNAQLVFNVLGEVLQNLLIAHTKNDFIKKMHFWIKTKLPIETLKKEYHLVASNIYYDFENAHNDKSFSTFWRYLPISILILVRKFGNFIMEKNLQWALSINILMEEMKPVVLKKHEFDYQKFLKYSQLSPLQEMKRDISELNKKTRRKLSIERFMAEIESAVLKIIKFVQQYESYEIAHFHKFRQSILRRKKKQILSFLSDHPQVETVVWELAEEFQWVVLKKS